MFKLFRSRKNVNPSTDQTEEQASAPNSENPQLEQVPEPSPTQRLAMQVSPNSAIDNLMGVHDSVKSDLSYLATAGQSHSEVNIPSEVTPASSQLFSPEEPGTHDLGQNSDSEKGLDVQATLKAPEVPETLVATAEDVRAAYKLFLGRLPESEEVVAARVGLPISSLLIDFLVCQEFLNQAQKQQIIIALAKKIIEQRKVEQERLKQPGDTQ